MQKPMKEQIALIIVITAAIIFVLVLTGMPAEAFAAVAGAAETSPSAEPGPLSLIVSALGVVLWVSTRRDR